MRDQCSGVHSGDETTGLSPAASRDVRGFFSEERARAPSLSITTLCPLVWKHYLSSREPGYIAWFDTRTVPRGVYFMSERRMENERSSYWLRGGGNRPPGS